MEVIRWIDIFGEGVIEYIVPFCLLLIIFRIISFIFQSFNYIQAIVYMLKVFMHFLLVIMIVIYYKKTPGGVSTIDILTGFTLLFSTVEMVDCSLMFIKEFSSKIMYASLVSMNTQIDSSRTDKEFRKVVSILEGVGIMLQHGKIDSNTIKKLAEVPKISRSVRWGMVDLMVKRGSGEEINFDLWMKEIFRNESIRRIMAYEKHDLEQPILLSDYKYKELNEIIHKVIKYKEIYLKELDKYKESEKVKQYVNSLENIERLEKKYFGIGKIVLDIIKRFQQKKSF